MNLFKRIATVILIFIISGQLKAQVNNVILPEPVKVEMGEGVFTLSKDVVIVSPSSNKEIKEYARLLSSQLIRATGYPLKMAQKTKTNKKTISLHLNKEKNAKIGEEGYQLTITPEKVELTANKPAGILYGIQSLLQLFPPEIEKRQATATAVWELPTVQITDYPRFGWRGLMLDVSRHFFQNEFVKKYIDQMVNYKLNVFHWHLSDDPGWRIEIKKYPKLTDIGAWRVPRTGRWGSYDPPQAGEAVSDGGFYTQEDIKEIVQYASERNITIVPEIDVPGHSAALIAAYPEVSCTGERYEMYPGSKSGLGANVLCAGNEKSFEMLDGILKEVASLFPGEYIHVGGDEVNKAFWKNCAKCQKRMADEGLKDEHELQSYFIKRVSNILEKYDKKLIGWDEILEGGLAEGAAVMSWRGPEGGIAAAKAGHYAVMSPLQYCYLDYQQSDMAIEQTGGGYVKLTDTYRFEPVPEGVDAKYILGGQGNLWTEFISSPGRAEYMTWPRAFAIAEILWSPKKERNEAAFVQKVEKHFARFDAAGVNYSHAIYDPQVHPIKDAQGQMQLTLNTEADNVDLYYTFDGTYPDQYANKYGNHPIAIPKGASDIRVIAYRDGRQIGRLLTRTVGDLLNALK